MKYLLLLLVSCYELPSNDKGQYYDLYRIGDKTPFAQCKKYGSRGMYGNSCGIYAEDCTDGSEWFCLTNVRVRKEK